MGSMWLAENRNTLSGDPDAQVHILSNCTLPKEKLPYYSLKKKKKNVKPEDPGYPVPFVISRIVTCVGQNLLFPFILSWETLA